jgi:hypothetical protein
MDEPDAALNRGEDRTIGERLIPLWRGTVAVFFELLWMVATLSILHRAGWLNLDNPFHVGQFLLDLIIDNFVIIARLCVLLVTHLWKQILDVVLFISHYDLRYLDITFLHALLLFQYSLGSSFSQEYYHLRKFLRQKRRTMVVKIEEEFQHYRAEGHGNKFYLLKGFITSCVIALFYLHLFLHKWDVLQFTIPFLIIWGMSAAALYLTQRHRKNARIKVVNEQAGNIWREKWTGDKADPRLSDHSDEFIQGMRALTPEESIREGFGDMPKYEERLPHGGGICRNALDGSFLFYISPERRIDMRAKDAEHARKLNREFFERSFAQALYDAKAGDLNAMADVGWRYLHAIGTDVDHIEARKWLDFASERGSSMASGVLAAYFAEIENPMKSAAMVINSLFGDKPAEALGFYFREVEGYGEVREELGRQVATPEFAKNLSQATDATREAVNELKTGVRFVPGPEGLERRQLYPDAEDQTD